MASHRFALGQSVKLRSWTGYLLTDAESYRVTALLPASDNSLQYRIRSDAERHERVAAEDNLEAAEPTANATAGRSA
jgi:hypothetical protein